MARAEELSVGIRSHVEDAERSLTNLVVNTSETIQTGARAAQQSLLTVSSDVGAQLKLTSAEVERAIIAVGTGAANSIVTSARDAQTTLVTASSDAAGQIKSLSADVERTLSAAGGATAPQSCRVRAKCRRPWSPPPPMRPTRSSRCPATSSARSSAAGNATAASILSSAREVKARWSRHRREAANHARTLCCPTSNARCRSPEPPPPKRSSRRPRGSNHPGCASAERGEPGQSRDLGGTRSLSIAGPPRGDHHLGRARGPQSTLVTARGCRQSRQVAGDRCRTHADCGRSGHRRFDPEQRARGAKLAATGNVGRSPPARSRRSPRRSSGRCPRSPRIPLISDQKCAPVHQSTARGDLERSLSRSSLSTSCGRETSVLAASNAFGRP